MQRGTSPIELHEKARTLWFQVGDVDPESEQYETADHRRASGAEANRAVGFRRSANWADALHRYEEFWRANEHTPRENTRNRSTLPNNERRLGEWARHQRRFDDRLTAYQRIRLDVSPAFEWDPHESRWRINLAASIQHVQTNGRLPRLTSADPAEFALGRWLGGQLRQLKSGTLSRDREAHINALLALPTGVPEKPTL